MKTSTRIVLTCLMILNYTLRAMEEESPLTRAHTAALIKACKEKNEVYFEALNKAVHDIPKRQRALMRAENSPEKMQQVCNLLTHQCKIFWLLRATKPLESEHDEMAEIQALITTFGLHTPQCSSPATIDLDTISPLDLLVMSMCSKEFQALIAQEEAYFAANPSSNLTEPSRNELTLTIFTAQQKAVYAEINRLLEPMEKLAEALDTACIEAPIKKPAPGFNIARVEQPKNWLQRACNIQ